MYLNTVFKYNVFKYCPALHICVWRGFGETVLEGSETHLEMRGFTSLFFDNGIWELQGFEGTSSIDRHSM